MKKLIIIIAVILIITGVYSKEYKNVMKKASNICMECIGIG